MTLAREQAIQTLRSSNLDIPGSQITPKHVIDIIALGRKLEPRERQLVLTELATRTWLEPRPLEGPLYPEFENVLWAYLSVQEGVEERIITSLGIRRGETDVKALYDNYLKGMFAASGKRRLDFYKDMLAEAGIAMDLGDAEFGDEADNFLLRVANSVHREHLLVFYSAGLALKISTKYNSTKEETVSEERLDAICRYFENGIPLEGQFLRYSESDVFIRYSLEKGRLSKI